MKSDNPNLLFVREAVAQPDLWQQVERGEIRVRYTNHRGEEFFITTITQQSNGTFILGGLGFALRNVDWDHKLILIRV